MACQSPHRSPHHAKHWTCHGRGLVTMGWRRVDGVPTPMVVPRWAQRQAMTSPHGCLYSPEPFTGGSHLHLVLEPHPMLRAIRTWMTRGSTS